MFTLSLDYQKCLNPCCNISFSNCKLHIKAGHINFKYLMHKLYIVAKLNECPEIQISLHNM